MDTEGERVGAWSADGGARSGRCGNVGRELMGIPRGQKHFTRCLSEIEPMGDNQSVLTSLALLVSS